MQESNADWHLVAKCIIYNIHLFNVEICDIPSDVESDKENLHHSNEEVSHSSYCTPDWERVSDLNINDFEFDSNFELLVKKGYEYDPNYVPEAEEVDSLEEGEELATQKHGRKDRSGKKGVKVAQSINLCLCRHGQTL